MAVLADCFRRWQHDGNWVHRHGFRRCSVPERWDSLSLNYINNPNDLWKGSMDDLADDAYLARLDKEMARRIACMHAYRNPIVNSCETKLDGIG
ncbi:hypothetical protein D918_06588 [Trichuris suis]|nr:hypothetical protein D918_06588 [Trichuris suis]